MCAKTQTIALRAVALDTNLGARFDMFGFFSWLVGGKTGEVQGKGGEVEGARGLSEEMGVEGPGGLSAGKEVPASTC